MFSFNQISLLLDRIVCYTFTARISLKFKGCRTSFLKATKEINGTERERSGGRDQIRVKYCANFLSLIFFKNHKLSFFRLLLRSAFGSLN